MGALIILCIISFFVGSKAEFNCVCNYNVELVVYSTMSDQAGNKIGALYEFDCKEIVPGVSVNKGWAAAAYEHKIGYVKTGANVNVQTCPGDPLAADLVTSTTASVTSGSGSTTALPASTGSPSSMAARTDISTQSFAQSSSTTPRQSTSVAAQTTMSPSTAPPMTTQPSSSVAAQTTMSPSTAPPVTTQPSSSMPTSMASSATTQPTSASSQSTATSATTPMTTMSSPVTKIVQSSTEHTTSSTPPTTMTFSESTTSVMSGAACPTTVTNPTNHAITTTYGQSCYEVVPHHASWSHAEADCIHKGGHLMHISNAQEQEFITKFLVAHYNHEVWIGLNDHHHEEQFEWTSGVLLTYSHWLPGRKDFFIHGSEDCVVLKPSSHGYWDDRQCSGIFAATHYYVCQYSGKHSGPAIIG